MTATTRHALARPDRITAADHAAPAPPALVLALMEARFLAEMAALSLTRRALRDAPGGDGHPVLVMPGLMTSDWSSRAMRRFLNGRGYAAHGWGLGVNRGTRGTLETDRATLLNRLADRHGRKVSLIGTSLGGIYARQLAKAFPHLTRSVITLGSPFAGSHLGLTHNLQVYHILADRLTQPEGQFRPYRAPEALRPLRAALACANHAAGRVLATARAAAERIGPALTTGRRA